MKIHGPQITGSLNVSGSTSDVFDFDGTNIDLGGGYIINEQGRQNQMSNAPYYYFDGGISGVSGTDDYIEISDTDKLTLAGIGITVGKTKALGLVKHEPVKAIIITLSPCCIRLVLKLPA